MGEELVLPVALFNCFLECYIWIFFLFLKLKCTRGKNFKHKKLPEVFSKHCFLGQTIYYYVLIVYTFFFLLFLSHLNMFILDNIEAFYLKIGSSSPLQPLKYQALTGVEGDQLPTSVASCPGPLHWHSTNLPALCPFIHRTGSTLMPATLVS